MLCDRFNDSTVAYQGSGRGLGINQVRDMCSLICGPTQPTLTFYLDVDPTVGLERSRATFKEVVAGQLDKIESEAMSFHRAVRQAFLQIAQQEHYRVQVIDAHQSSDLVLQQALVKILERLA